MKNFGKKEYLITICIPVYNGERFIRECLNSIMNQEYLEECEILIVDDYSGDKSLQVIESFIEKNKPEGNWRIEKNRRNLGLTNNWNRCCELANGQWIMFLFQDDYLESNAVKHRRDLINNHSSSLYISDRKYVFENSVEENLKSFYDKKLKRLSDYYSSSKRLGVDDVAELFINNYLGQNFIGEPVVGIFKKELLEKYGYFNNQLRQRCDYEFWLRIGLNEGFYFDNEKVVNFRIHGGSTTKQNSKSSVSIGVVDRVKFGSDLLSQKHYAKFRSWYKKQSYSLSLSEIYQEWCLENIPLRFNLLSYKNEVENHNFKIGYNFIYNKIREKFSF